MAEIITSRGKEGYFDFATVSDSIGEQAQAQLMAEYARLRTKPLRHKTGLLDQFLQGGKVELSPPILFSPIAL